MSDAPQQTQGRPSDYSTETAANICAMLAEGLPLVKICRGDGMPTVRTVYRWLTVHDEFRHMYARAREDQADTLADEIVDIADEDPASVFDEERMLNGKEVDVVRVDGAAIAHQRLRVDARKWVAAKLKPKKYGDTSAIALSNPDGTGLMSGITVSFVKPDSAVPS